MAWAPSPAPAADGRPHLTPNWFLWDREQFCVSTTKDRVKYRISVEASDDLEAGLPYLRALRAKHGRPGQSDEELRAEMVRDDRVLLVVTPSRPQRTWLARGF